MHSHLNVKKAKITPLILNLSMRGMGRDQLHCSDHFTPCQPSRIETLLSNELDRWAPLPVAMLWRIDIYLPLLPGI